MDEEDEDGENLDLGSLEEPRGFLWRTGFSWRRIMEEREKRKRKKIMDEEDENGGEEEDGFGWAGHEDMTRYLYCKTLQQECPNRDHVFYLLEECITKKMFRTRVKVDKGSVLSDGSVPSDGVGSVAAQRRALDEDEFVRSGAVEATFQAIKNGIPEIAIEIAKITNILWNRTDPEDGRNMFACAAQLCSCKVSYAGSR
ncbi:hypothetical protein SLEP1_g53554 [Rubroshorea leprosula]|uniref:Uncharacterized protein n=1 Tax=Rubroshorea leprosula TaxID=152421 RepID=A0AAV5MDA6_9ROSI|nr:hypothetical protein SLEP1_g53554 [Rubroshorea leprosula]